MPSTFPSRSFHRIQSSGCFGNLSRQVSTQCHNPPGNLNFHVPAKTTILVSRVVVTCLNVKWEVTYTTKRNLKKEDTCLWTWVVFSTRQWKHVGEEVNLEKQVGSRGRLWVELTRGSYKWNSSLSFVFELTNHGVCVDVGIVLVFVCLKWCFCCKYLNF